VVIDNDIVQVTISNPEGCVTGIQYNGLDNLLEIVNQESDRGYTNLNSNITGFYFYILLSFSRSFGLSMNYQ